MVDLATPECRALSIAPTANVTAYMRSLGLDKTSIQFSDLDWDRTWLSTLDPAYKSASGDKTIEFPFGKYDDARVKEAFGHTIYDAGIYFGHSSARERIAMALRLGRRRV